MKEREQGGGERRGGKEREQGEEASKQESGEEGRSAKPECVPISCSLHSINLRGPITQTIHKRIGVRESSLLGPPLSLTITGLCR